MRHSYKHLKHLHVSLHVHVPVPYYMYPCMYSACTTCAQYISIQTCNATRIITLSYLVGGRKLWGHHDVCYFFGMLLEHTDLLIWLYIVQTCGYALSKSSPASSKVPSDTAAVTCACLVKILCMLLSLY